MTVENSETNEQGSSSELSLEDLDRSLFMLNDEDLDIDEDYTPRETSKEDNPKEEKKEDLLDPLKKDDKSAVVPTPEDDASKKDFVFNRKQYEDMGITDEKLLKTLEDKDKQIFHSQKAIGSQGQKIGFQKKDIQALTQTIARLEASKIGKDEINEMSFNDLEQATETVINNKNIEKEIQNVKQEISKAQVQEFMLNKIPDFESKIDVIADILLKEDEIDPSVVANWKIDPYKVEVPILLNLYKRAAAQEKSSVSVESLTKENIELKETIKKIKENANFVTNGLKSAGKKSGLDNMASKSTDSTKKTLTEKDFMFMDDSELEDL